MLECVALHATLNLATTRLPGAIRAVWLTRRLSVTFVSAGGETTIKGARVWQTVDRTHSTLTEVRQKLVLHFTVIVSCGSCSAIVHYQAKSCSRHTGQWQRPSSAFLPTKCKKTMKVFVSAWAALGIHSRWITTPP
jgi:hypothetical protein